MTPESLGYLLHRLLHAGVKTAMRTRYPMRASGIVVLVAAALLGGCAVPVKSFEPLVDKQHVVSDPEIVGKWLLYGDDETLYVLEVEAENNDTKAYKVTFSDAGFKSVYRAKLGRWDKDEFADVESASAGEALEREANPFVVSVHSFCRIRREGDILRLAYIELDSNNDWAKAHLPKEKWRKITGFEHGSHETGLVFTGTTEELQTFVLNEAQNDDAFYEFRFAREGTLAAYSQSLEVGYKGSAKLYTEQREYEQAAVAWTRYVELEPKDPDGHSELAMALLGSNKSGQAREEFAEAIRLCGQVPRPRGDGEAHTRCKEDNADRDGRLFLGVAFFLVDQYEQASHEFEKALLLKDTWYEPVIWDYLALRGAGKEAAAKDLLERSAKKVQENASQLRLTQYLGGQITEAALLDPPKEVKTKVGQCEVFFALGSEALIAGDKAKARESFAKAAPESVYCPAFIAAAVNARLKQLAAK